MYLGVQMYFRLNLQLHSRVWRKNAVLDGWKLLVTNTSYSYGFDANVATNHDDPLSHALEDSVVDLFDRAYNSLLRTLKRISRWHPS